ncbi:branched-chain amino acid ABC transporter permease [Gemmobacter nectariphilus]|uniref:branched-chain amino acid ABC transporter permease n=1 Tax=Gemmobacter nectariphilus TaxID=220343 RepID=UPI0003FA7327|nr:branched-chain amino acid ABC transporter permease [Gemmobacter nectariphilus]
MSGYWAGILSILAVNIIFAYAIFIPVATGQLNLGGAGFQAIGAYTAAFLSASVGLSVTFTLLAATIMAGIAGGALAFPILRTRGVYLILATFAFAEVVAGVILNSETLGGAMGMSVPGYVEWYVPCILAGAVTVFVFYLMATRFGLNMRAIHDDDVVSDLMGVNVRMTKVIAFAIGAALAGLAGGLYAHTFTYVEVQGFNAMVSIYVLLYVLLGGTQTAWGPIVGASFFTLLPEFLRAFLPKLQVWVLGVLGQDAATVQPPDESWRFVLLGVITVLMMAFRPEGFVTRDLVDRFSWRSRRLRTPDGAKS